MAAREPAELAALLQVALNGGLQGVEFHDPLDQVPGAAHELDVISAEERVVVPRPIREPNRGPLRAARVVDNEAASFAFIPRSDQ